MGRLGIFIFGKTAPKILMIRTSEGHLAYQGQSYYPDVVFLVTLCSALGRLSLPVNEV